MRISDWSSEVCASDLLTTYGSPDRLMLASSRFEVPVIVQRDSFGAEHLGAYYEVCRRDIASDPVDERKPHRSIIRIDGKSEMGHILQVDAVVPAWRPDHAVPIPIECIATELRDSIVPGMYLLGDLHIDRKKVVVG